MKPQLPLTRREVLKTLGAGAAVLGLGAVAARSTAAEGASAVAPTGPLLLPKLDYAYDALEPHIDARTMEIHHTKHHQAYITNANKAIVDDPKLQQMQPEVMLQHLEMLPAGVRTTLRNNVGGHVNHSFFWKVIGPKGGGAPTGPVADTIGSAFGSYDKFKAEFTDAAMKRFGSGWAWLVVRKGAGLAVTSTANQDSPLSEGATPILGLDVWEHAYYLKYQNRRSDYVAAFWNVVNWQQVNANLAVAPRA